MLGGRQLMCLNRDLGVVLFVVVSWISSLAYPSLPGIKGFVVVVVVVVLFYNY